MVFKQRPISQRAAQKGMNMNICIAGNGKLANALMSGLSKQCEITRWDDLRKTEKAEVYLIHAGSGRQLQECLHYCNETNSILIELSTGTLWPTMEIKCPVINCPNTAIPIVMMLNILREYGNDFQNYKIRIVESHQAGKKTAAGTALAMADSFSFPPEQIESIRNADDQRQIGIQEEYLHAHAYHKIIIEEEGCAIAIECKVLGHAAYTEGIKHLIAALRKKKLENRIYQIAEIMEMERRAKQ